MRRCVACSSALLVAGWTMIGVAGARHLRRPGHGRRTAVPPDRDQPRRRRRPRHLRRARGRGLPAVPPRRPRPADVPARRLRTPDQPARSAAAGCCSRVPDARRGMGRRPRRRWRSSPRVLAMLTAWTAVRRFGVRPTGGAVRSSPSFACTAPLATYATQVYPEIPAALAVMVAVAALTRATRSARARRAASSPSWRCRGCRSSTRPSPRPWRCSRCGALRRSAPEPPPSAPRSPSRACVYLVVHSRRSTAAGRPTPPATTSLDRSSSRSSGPTPNYLGRSRRLVGLLVDDDFGIAAWMLGWLALPFAIGSLLRRRPRDWTVLVAAARRRLAHGDVRRARRCTAGGGRAASSSSCCRSAVIVDRRGGRTAPRCVVRVVVVAAVLGAGDLAVDDGRGDHPSPRARRRLRRDRNPWIRLWRLAPARRAHPTAADDVLTIVVDRRRGRARRRRLGATPGRCRLAAPAGVSKVPLTLRSASSDTCC